MKVKDNKVVYIGGGDLLLELLDSELKSSEWRKHQSGEDLEEVRKNMNFGVEL